MGQCCGSAEVDEAQDAKVQKELDVASASTEHKLLLLGVGGSGKSTIFKQLQCIYSKGFAQRDRVTFKSQIYEQIIEALKIMLVRAEEYVEESEDETTAKKYRIQDSSESSAEILMSTRSNVDLTEEIASHMKILWSDPAMKEMFAIRNVICVPDSTAHFLNKLDTLKTVGYVPSDEDLLLVRYRTTGMAEKTFAIDGHKFRVVDVGGQRNERRKWIHFFDSVTAVIFVASLSSYDECPFEDETANSMLESLQVFHDNLNSSWFVNTAFILFLNKRDLFEDKIKKVSLTECFAEYNGDTTVDSGLKFIQQKFESQNENPEEREVYCHVTQATDTENVHKVFNDVQHIVINWSLQMSGLL